MKLKIFEVENLEYSYPESTKLDISIGSFSIRRGEFLLVLGRSGCGKSTFGRLMGGIVPKFYGGRMHSEKLQGKRAAMVFQDPEKQLVMKSVERDIAFGMENMGYDRPKMKRRVAEVLSYLNITDIKGSSTTSISGGQKQKVAIGSAIAMGNDFMVLDEITSQLDPKSAQEVLNIVRSLNEDLGYTIVLIEQRLDRVFDMADRIVFMEEGRIVFDGCKRDFLKSPYASKGPFMPPVSEFFSKLGIYDVWNVKSGRLKLSKIDMDRLEELIAKDGIYGRSRAASAAIEVENLEFTYAKDKVLRRVSLSVMEGEAMALIGENGSGKSTLLKNICGLLKGDGDIRVKGEIGYLSQNPNDYLFNDSVYEELMFTAKKKNVAEAETAVEYMISKLDMEEFKDQNPRDLSGGQRQRVALGSILVFNPQIVIMDEPTRGLDIAQKERIGGIIKGLRSEGKSVLVVTHDMEFVARYMDTVALMAGGAVVDKSEKHKFFADSINYSTDLKRLFRGMYDDVISIKDFDFDAAAKREAE